MYLVQKKTAKASDTAWIRFKVTDKLQTVITRCQDNIASPFLIHRKPQRLLHKQAQTKEHWTKVEDRFLKRTFVKDCYRPRVCKKAFANTCHYF